LHSSSNSKAFPARPQLTTLIKHEKQQKEARDVNLWWLAVLAVLALLALLPAQLRLSSGSPSPPPAPAPPIAGIENGRSAARQGIGLWFESV
jgi:hypothetical protein